MSQHWERRYDFVHLEQPTLHDLLQPAFLGKQVASAQLLTAGYCNTNYKINIEGLNESFVLRLYVRDRNACQKDLDVFQLVHKNVPIPEIVYADPDGTHYPLPYSIMRWVDGVLLSEILASGNIADITNVAYDVGATLAAISTCAFPQSGFFGPGLIIAQPFHGDVAAWLAAIEHFLFKGRAGERLGVALTDRLWTFVTMNKEYLAPIEGIASLVHSDFKGINILVRQDQADWKVAAVLDWEFAFASSPLYDIGNMLRYDQQYPPVFEQQFIQGFREHGGNLPAEWKKIVKLLDLVSLCEFLDAPHRRDTLITNMTQLVIATLARWNDLQ
jgi:aminoglycoside phosphotransferase (APT) family kinase protein